MKAVVAGLPVLVSTLASAQDWTHRMTEDAFTDEKIWVASVHDRMGEQEFTLFVNCQQDGSVNAGITGTNMNPVGGEWAYSREHFRIPVRFDKQDPTEEHFVEQGRVLLLTMAPTLRRLLPEHEDSIEQRTVHIFVKRLADGTRLRVKFPQFGGHVVLDFPLSGAKDALLAVARGCNAPAAEGTKAFLDAQGEPYSMLADMLIDGTWHLRK